MRCKVCKVKFEPKFFNQKVCLSAECVLINSKEVKLKQYSIALKKNNTTPKAKKKTSKELLQIEVNKLSRRIDSYFNYKCIDCSSEFTSQVDAAHYHNSQGNENIRFNLHNLHAARSHCNRYNSEHKKGYRLGLIERYGEEYYNMVETELGIQYSYLGLTEVEIKEALKIVRKLNREFDQHAKGNYLDGSIMRSYFNNLIGIYE